VWKAQTSLQELWAGVQYVIFSFSTLRRCKDFEGSIYQFCRQKLHISTELDRSTNVVLGQENSNIFNSSHTSLFCCIRLHGTLLTLTKRPRHNLFLAPHTVCGHICYKINRKVREKSPRRLPIPVDPLYSSEL
jgi:hypothetical protein